MAWPTVEQELGAAQHKITELMHELEEKEKQVHSLESDMNFHLIKCEEMEDLLQTKTPTDHERKLQVKILQNAGLMVQLQELRNQIDEANSKHVNLDKELWDAQDNIRRLNEERRSHQRMVIEMSDVLRMLGAIDIEYGKTEEVSSWSTPESLDNIKNKIRAIEDDRQKNIQENHKLQTELLEKTIELDSLKDQDLLLQTASEDRDRLKLEKSMLAKLCKKQASRIRELEHSGDVPGNFPIKNVMYENFLEEDEESDVEAVLQNDGSTVVVPSFGKGFSRVKISSTKKQSKSEERASSSHGSSAVNLEGLDLASPEDVEKLVQVLRKTERKYVAAKKKQELREKLLRDVIFQYKMLQKEHDDANARLSDLGLLPDDHSNFSSVSSKGRQPIRKDKSILISGSLEECPTFDTAEISHTQSLSATDAGSNVSTQDEMNEPTEITEDGYRHLEKECARLEHEYEDAITRISNLEDDLAFTKKELDEANSKSSNREKAFSDLELKFDLLEADFKASVDKSVRLQEDLSFAEEQAAEAKKKRDERELDLWDVIDQYKKLSEENEDTLQKIQSVEHKLDETQAKKKSVERELGVTQRHIKRKDLIYDNMRMDQKIYNYEQKIESLDRSLKQARSEAARNKEDARSIRKLLNGCNYNFQQLQVRYEELINQQAAIEKEVSRAERMSQLSEKVVGYRRTQQFAKSHRRLLKARQTFTPSVAISAAV